MKRRKTVKYLFIIVILFHTITLNSQDWKWDWTSTITAQIKGSMIEDLHVDQYNNVYGVIPYSGPIYIGDTSFNFGSTGDMFANYVFAKYDAFGQFDYAINVRNGDFHYPEIETDLNQNIYIAGDFRHYIYINDSLITMNPGSSSNHGEVLLCKMNPQKEIVWTGMISNQWADNINSFCASPGRDAFYLATEHYANGDQHILNYFNQDTSLPFNKPMSTLVKVDTSCNILWKKELRTQYFGADCRKVFNGGDGNVYLFGDGRSDFYVGEDTIYHPYWNIGGYDSMFWLLKYSQDGEFLDGFYFDWDIWFYELEVDLLGNIYVTGSLMDTAVIGQDTLIVPEGQDYRIIGKFDSELQPLWYEVFEEQENQNIYFRNLELDNDHLIFAGHATGELKVGDSIFDFGSQYRESVVGEFGPDGEILNFVASDCGKDFSHWQLILDNCKNPLVCGMFAGDVLMGPQEFSSYSNDFEDGYITKIIRNEPEQINLGGDTTVCQSLILQAPAGYQNYIWNNQATNQNSLLVTETGEYTVAMGTSNGCWSYDTINVYIDFAEDVYLGPDTSMKENDTLVFEIIGNYTGYLWSDSTTSNQTEIIGLEYGVGFHEIWVEVTKGSCVKKDTIMVEVKSEFGYNELLGNSINIYPNPFKESFVVKYPKDTERIAFYRLDGSLVKETELKNHNENSYTFSMEAESAGVYMIRIFTKYGSHSGKLLKK